MKISAALRKIHKELSLCNLKFLEYAQKNPESLRDYNYDSLDLNDELFILQPWPTFINGYVRDEVARASVEVFNLIKSVPDRILGCDPEKVSDYLEIPLERAKLELETINDAHLKNLLARGDFIYSKKGWKCIEFNVTANLGGWMAPLWESLYYQTRPIADFLSEYRVDVKNRNLISSLFDHLINAFLEKHEKRPVEHNVAIMFLMEDLEAARDTERYLNDLYRTSLKSSHSELAGKLVLCEHSELEVVDGHLYYGDSRIHSLIEMNHGYVPSEILEVFKSGNLCLYNGPISALLSDKLILALLSDNIDINIFTGKEREIIDTYVPWTRKISAGGTYYRGEKIDDLIDFILTEKDELIIKPSKEYGGTGVCVGRKASDLQWEGAVKTAINERNWLVQEFIESYPYLYQFGTDGCVEHDAAWGFFVLGTEYAGGWVRVLPRTHNKGVINCHQGARVSVIFEVEE